MQHPSKCAVRPGQVGLPVCRYPYRIGQILSSKLNLTFNYSQNMTKLEGNSYGYIYFMAGSPSIDEISRWALQSVKFGHHLIYCNYGKINVNQFIGVRLDFSPFTSIYTVQVWWLILLTVVTLFVLLQHSGVTVWFDAVTVFIRQLGSGKNYVPICLTSLLCLPLLAVYENELASKIIVRN
ncbi:hypothetical protein Fcan01_19084 [Folsomia candida]|uniref:Uncharacterized protein n=1 Tax=Folsomia candida TaxID=158441 RepID=A0A226DP75_FOLCA|nr:hypothetical protein Fcan01_19084 [Folsomia candida]